MDEGNNITFKYNPEKETSNRTSILEARAQRKQDAKELGSDIPVLQKEIQSYLSALNQFKKDYGDLSKTQQKDFNNLTAYAEKLKKVVSDTNVDYAETLKLVSDVASFLDRSKDRAYDLKVAQTESEEEYIALIQERNELEEMYGDIVSDNAKKLETHKRAQESLYDSVHKGIKDLKDSVKDIAVVSGLDNIYNQMSGKNGQIASYNTMRSQFAMTKSDFNTFKRDIASTIMENGNITKYGFQDALDYMNRLGELGITDQEIAKEQMEAIMLSTKYLGMSADTQSKILKQARNTGNMDLLNQTNQTMVQIMNAQLGIAKDQLDALVNQSTSIADLSIMFSGNKNALQSFTQSGSAIESVYGEAAAKATMNIAQDLLSRGASSQYTAVLGENYGSILAALQSGDGNALFQILQAVQGSSVTGAGASNSTAYGVMGGAGLIDENTTVLYNSRASEGKSYSTAMESIASSSNSTKDFLNDMQQDFKSVLENVTSWVGAWLPIGSLQTIFYGLAIADMAFGVGRNLLQIKAILAKQMIPGLKDLISGNKDSLELLGSAGAGKTGGLLGSVGAIAATLSIIAGVAWGISDALTAKGKADEWGVSEGSAMVGGFLGGTETNSMTRTLKNTGKFALIGAGVGSIIPGVGTAVGAIVGGLLGLGLGLVGGENIAQAFGDAHNAPVVNYGIGGVGSTGNAMGASMPVKSFPWGVSSPFGYRGTINTPAGPTNPFHDGIDLTNGEGTPIGANNSGIVVASTTASDGANYVIINSGDGYEQLYWHLMKPSHLIKGQHVNAGQLIGYMGQTGMATGPHLHFGLRHAGTKNYLDPAGYINATLFSPTDAGIPGLGVLEEEETPSTQILRKMIDADTTSNVANSMANYGVGSDQVVDSVNNGFTNLIDKLEELSKRQDRQEDVLKMLAQSKGTNVYRY